MAAALYPAADIRPEGFEVTKVPDGSFDLVVGNVPFGSVALHDPVHNPGRHSIHSHFLIKGLHLTRPGGLVAAITSRFTLDARNPAARREIADLADLLGAVRLPAGAFRAAAGTDAICDIVLLRRRAPDDPVRSDDPWLRAVDVAVDGGTVWMNEWLARHPESVLGELRVGGGQYRDDDLTVVAMPGPISPPLDAALSRLVTGTVERGLGWRPRSVLAAAAPVAKARGPLAAPDGAVVAPHHKEGSIIATPEGGFAIVAGGRAVRYEPRPKADRAELAALANLRDAVVRVIEVQAQSHDDDRFATAQAALNRSYDAYVARFGPLNRFSLVSAGRDDPATGAPAYRRRNPPMGGFRHDPDFPLLTSLEHFDPDMQTATKAAVFTSRVVAPRTPKRGADSSQDALAICLDENGRVDLDTIADLLGADADRARTELGTLVWDDPTSGELVPAAVYLSGDVRAKLAVAVEAARRDERFRAHVEALEAVVPPDLAPGEIDARLGAAWIPAADVETFASDFIGARGVIVDHAPATATWAVAAPTHERRTVAATSTWGTERADAFGLLQSSLNQQAATVYDVMDDGSRVLNAAETLGAREKQEAIENRFATWVWEEPERAGRLAGRYNELFNATVLPRYDGSHLTLPGLSCDFRPNDHQRDAVWRIIQEPAVLLAHAVGAGKTATMVMAGMELRRLGLARKPAYVVPNHMLEQFSAEFLRLYPQARVLVAGRDDTTPAARKGFVARCATGDWDAVIITRSSFERIPVSVETRRRFLERRLSELREAVRESKGLTVKRLELTIARTEERHKRLLAADRKDDGVCFEATGLDYICADESQAYKNRHFQTRIPGVGGEGSARAEDMDLKLDYLRSRYGARVATFATATPIANSLAEMYVVQSYLQPDALERAGVAHFDAWAATFGRTITTLELAPDGASYRLATRFARFRNVPELLTMFRSVADVRVADELPLAVPSIAGGRPETIVVQPSEPLLAYVQTLAVRADAVRSRLVRPDEDNMLKISGDGRKAALDLRLVGEPDGGNGGKISVCAERAAEIYHSHRDRPYWERGGETAARTGSLQLVFSDMGTPSSDGGWSVYDELRRRLADRGVPSNLVRFVHDAADDRAKAELFAACRDGRVAVLIGSTEKMGVGTNVQRRLVALHHLDCPWRPADIEQREGRALRQGNQNPEVHIVRYVTEGSFDIFMWQTVERKAAFIHQVIRANVAGREIEDIGEQALSYAEVKALATGNPLLMEKAAIDNEIARLSRLRRAHHHDQTRLAKMLDAAESRIERLETIIDQCDAAISRRVDTRGDRFSMTVGTTGFVERKDAGQEFRAALAEGWATNTTAGRVGELGGFPVEARWERDSLGDAVIVQLQGSPTRLTLTKREVAAADPVGLVQQLEHRLRGLEQTRDDARTDLDRIRNEAKVAVSRIGAPFEHEARLTALVAKAATVQQELTQIASTPSPPAPREIGPDPNHDRGDLDLA